MSDRKFTDDEIIKAVKCCISEESEDYNCKACPYDDHGCCNSLLQDALVLINRQKAEIERLKELLEAWKTEAYKVADEKDELYCNAIERVKTAKSEAIKEFAERAKKKMQDLARVQYGSNEIYFLISESFIDNIAEELAEGTK